MAENENGADRSEDPTQKKLDEALERGDVAKSQEVNTWFIIAGSTLILMSFSGSMSSGLQTSLRGFLANAHDIPVDGRGIMRMTTTLGFELLAAIGIPFLVLVLAAIALLISISRLRHRKKLLLTPLPSTAQAQPDLSQEDVTADQSDEAGWLALADQLQATGQLRLALRASYLASLAHLSQRELIRLARFKSNRDYDRELHRRARSFPILLSAFNHILLTFESAWYGDHPVTASTLADFSKSLDQIRSC